MGIETVTTAGVKVLERNAYRRSIVFHNKSAETIWLETMEPNGISIANAGIRIPEGGVISFNWQQDGAQTVVDTWSAISESGSPVLVVREQNGLGLPTVELEKNLGKENQ
jgi:hypothetical protein